MKLIFNDATDMPIQSYEKIGGAGAILDNRNCAGKAERNL